MIRMHALAAAAVVLPLLTAATAATAATSDMKRPNVDVIGNYQDWEALTYMEKGHRVCFMGTKPKKSAGNYTKRGDIYLLVTHRPAEHRIGVVIVETGYTYKKGSTVAVRIDGKPYRMWTQGQYAYAYANEDKVLVKAMRQGLKMTVEGHSDRGTATTDTYSLNGFTTAYKAISKKCGVAG